MSGVRVLVQLARADFLERVRRHSFLVTLGFTVFAAYLFLPPNHARYSTLRFAGHRGIYNSAWVGSVIAMLSATFLGLAGFYLVKNAVERDRRTGVGQILAATPLSTPFYLAGKLASNVAVLGAMVAVLAAAAAVMQIVRGEDLHLQPLALVSPFVVLTLPVMALVAALAVVFEVTPGLRGGLGNVVYFFLWMSSLSLTAAARGRGLPDPLGGEMLIGQMHAACAAAFADLPAGRGLSMGFNIKTEGVWDLETFRWGGATWTPAMLAARAAWVAVSVALTMAAALFFDRFDAHAPIGRREGRRRARRAPAAGPGREAGALEPPPDARDTVPAAAQPVPLVGWTPPAAGLLQSGAGDPAPAAGNPMAVAGRSRSVGFASAQGAAEAQATHARRATRAGGGRLRMGALVIAELRITLKGVSRWWLLVVLGLAVASLFVPLPAVKQFIVPFALVWPLLLWSPIGTREQQHRTDALLFSAPRPVARLLVAQWLTGAALALAVASGALVRFTIAGQWESLASLLTAAVFIPSMALGFGTWSGSGKLFEVLYLILWYVGPMNRIAALDYVGVTQPASGSGPVVTFLLLAGALAGLALAGRLRQLGR